MMRCRKYLHWKLIPKFHRARHKVPQESNCSKPSAIDEVKMKIKSFTSSVMEKFSTRQYIERLPWALPMINRVIRYIGMQHPSAWKTGQASQKVPGHWKFERLFLECVIMEQVDTYFSRHFSSEMSTNSIPYNVYLENYEVVDDELAPNIGPDLLGIPNFFEANLAFPSKWPRNWTLLGSERTIPPASIFMTMAGGVSKSTSLEIFSHISVI